ESVEPHQDISEAVEADVEETLEPVVSDELTDAQSDFEQPDLEQSESDTIDALDLDDLDLPSFTEENALVEPLGDETLPDLAEESVEP
ncbi:hypothetical protein AB4666_22605, partial [Vibrio amylolyticus]